MRAEASDLRIAAMVVGSEWHNWLACGEVRGFPEWHGWLACGEVRGSPAWLI